MNCKLRVNDYGNEFYIDYGNRTPGHSEKEICKFLNMDIEDYHKKMEEFNGVEDSITIYEKPEDDSIEVYDYEDATIFFNKEDANTALDWVEAQFLAKTIQRSMSDIERLGSSITDYELEPTFVDYIGWGDKL